MPSPSFLPALYVKISIFLMNMMIPPSMMHYMLLGYSPCRVKQMEGGFRLIVQYPQEEAIFLSDNAKY
jgi:hypothetical protein